MQQKQYKFTLQWLPADGSVVDPIVLEHNPVEWDKMGLNIGRHERYKAVDVGITLDKFTFVREGADYHKTAYDTDGFDYNMTVIIETLDNETQIYVDFFSGYVKKQSYNRQDKPNRVGVNIITSDAQEKLKSREKINYDVLSTINADGDASATIANIPQPVNFRTSDIFTDAKVDFALFPFANNDVPVWVGVAATYNSYQNNEISLPQTSKTLYTNNSSETKSVVLSGSVDPSYFFVTVPSAGTFIDISYRLKAKVQNNPSVVFLEQDNRFGISLNVGLHKENFLVDPFFNSTFTVPSGEYLEFWMERSINFYGTPGAFVQSEYYPIKNLLILEKSDVSVTKERNTILFYEAFAKLMDNINGKAVYSEPLGRTDSSPTAYGSDGEYSLTCFESGYMLRGFELSDKPFTMNFKDFWQTISSVYALALEYNQTLDRFEIKKEVDVFDETTLIESLGHVKDYEEYPAEDFIFSDIESGYKDSADYEENNGTQEYNVPAQFEIPIEGTDTKRDLKSTYNGAGLMQTFAVLKDIATNGAEDTRYDNKTCITVIRRDGGDYETDRDEDFAVDGIEGVYGIDTRMNLKITPKRNLLRHSQLATPLYKKPGTATINFRKSETSIPLETQLLTEGAPVVELASELKTNLISSKVKPIFHKFEYPVKPALLAKILADKNGYFEFLNDNDETIEIYIWDLTIDDYPRNSTFIGIEKA
jgi:hypothetical protein